jgi:hypothetical protein
MEQYKTNSTKAVTAENDLLQFDWIHRHRFIQSDHLNSICPDEVLNRQEEQII